MRKKRYYSKRKIRIIILILFTALIFFLIEYRLKPILSSVAEIQAQAMATTIINESIDAVLDETGIKGDELEEISVLSDGTLAAIHCNTVLTNRIKNAVTLRIQDGLSDIKNRRIEIPIGTIIGSELSNGRGPGIPIYISLSGNVKSDFIGKFEDGGMNQTVHTQSMLISADIRILMPFGSTSTTVETSVLIGESVIVGKVPSGMILKTDTK